MILAVLRVTLSDARANWLSWIALAATLLVSGGSVAFALAFMMEDASDSASLGGSILGLAVVSIVASSTTLTKLLTSERQATYGKWKLVGMPAAGVVVAIVLQLVAVAAVSSWVGTLLSNGFIPQATDILESEGVAVGSPALSPQIMAISVAVCIGAALLGAGGSMFSVVLAPAAKSQRKSIVPVAKPGVMTTLLGLMLGGGCVAIFSSEDISAEDPDALIAVSTFGLMVMLCLAGWYIRIVLQWTHIGRAFGEIGVLAGASIRARSAFTSAQVMPWFLVAGIFVGIGSPMNVLLRESGGNFGNISAFLVLLGPAIVPALVGGVSSLCIMAPRMRDDAEVLRLSGASKKQVCSVMAGESVLVAVTAGWLTLGLALFGVLSANHFIFGTAFPDGWAGTILWKPFALIIGTMAVAIFLVKLALVAKTLR